MEGTFRPGTPLIHKYNVSKEDIEGMVKSGLPDEIVTAEFIDNQVECKQRFNANCTEGWWIRVQRKLYGEWYIVDTFVDHELVQFGPDWLEHHHGMIDTAFEKTRKSLPQALH